MPQNKEINRRIVLASRPHGAPVPENFRLETPVVGAATGPEKLAQGVHGAIERAKFRKIGC